MGRVPTLMCAFSGLPWTSAADDEEVLVVCEPPDELQATANSAVAAVTAASRTRGGRVNVTAAS